MSTSKTRKAIGLAAAVLGTALVAGSASSVQAETLIPGVTGCAAAGVKQERGALIGAVAGGLLGNSISGHNRTTGTVVGATVGAAAGSAAGCQMQHNDERAAESYGRPAAATYSHGGYRLSSAVQPASYSRMGEIRVATASANLRAAPAAGSPRVGQLRAGERFQALAKVRGTDWVLVGQDGVGVGYVHGAYARPANPRYANGY